ncbi:hypothetical protein [Sinomonas sp. ASV322]|uniref:hypothetical protein n=1 Tax=Sinomonas sp. ASV322 TaxID=3041920 RepID=UPI0027DBDC92|nr:hypothetical protein [Sinomonas sp. ASV322]MDQ4501302.1 hypothetical protein [Sinomonas sp. ASV322]
MTDIEAVAQRLVARFERENIRVVSTEERAFPEEVMLVAYVAAHDFNRAVELSSDIEDDFHDPSGRPVMLVVRRTKDMAETPEGAGSVTGVSDARVGELVRLISAKSRVSSVEPNLVYVPDARASLSTITASRHHLVFGRRGAGKSALLMEARRALRSEGAVISWTNIQTLRHETPQRIFLYVLKDLLESVIAGRRSTPPQSALALSLGQLHGRIQDLLLADTPTETEDAQRLVPQIQRALSSYLEIEGNRAFAFIDDFYYVPRDMQPDILDLIHGAIRDTNTWIKIASIRHLTNWWRPSPPTGLQSGQDADLIDLDVTLQEPDKAGKFLEGILAEYASRVGISSLSRIFNRPALDRLVLASGAVPRDYMVLAVSALNRAQRRRNARVAGVQDVNQAAGDAASSKIQELEEDMAANRGVAARTVKTLQTVRKFCLDETAFTYFLVDHREKEDRPFEYGLLADLMDVRLIHLIDAGVSAAHEAGSRYEAYMLDLSQFSGSRLKQRITVLDFEDRHFVSKVTRSSTAVKKGATSRQLVGILRGAPEFKLASLSFELPDVTTPAFSD